jgi:hypothetical protein
MFGGCLMNIRLVDKDFTLDWRNEATQCFKENGFSYPVGSEK